MNKKKWFYILKISCFSFLTALIAFLISIIINSYLLYNKLSNIYQIFLQNALIDNQTFQNILRTGLENQTNNKNLTFLILGLDSLEKRTSPPLTDSILILNINLEKQKINLLSLPRDLYLKDYKSKINALYYYEQQQQKPQMATEIISSLIQKPIDYTVILQLNQIKELIDLIGGLDINLQHSFIDKKFPLENVDFDLEKNPEKWYETIEFQAGFQTLSGKQTLQYMRSRYSQDAEGNDQSRNQRQQEIIKAFVPNLINKIYQPKKNPNLLDFALLGKLWNFYQTNFNQYFSIQDLITLTADIIQNKKINFNFNQCYLTIYPDNNDGVLFSPPVQKYQQWVYEIYRPQEFNKLIQQCWQ